MSKRPQLLKLIAAHPEAHDDPSLLHPLFARLPPLYPDTPDAPTPPPPVPAGSRPTRSSTRKPRGGSRSASRSRSRSRRREKTTPVDEKPVDGVEDEKAAVRSELDRSTTLAPDPPAAVDEKIPVDLDGPILAELEPRSEAIVTDTLSQMGNEVLETVEIDFETPPARDEEVNPFTPLVLSEVFRLADELMEKYPFDGEDVRGNEVLGPGSVVRTWDWERRGRPSDSDGVEGEDAAAEEDEGEESSSDSDGVRTPRHRRTPFTHTDAEACIDTDVIVPGGDELDDLDEDTPAQTVKRVPRHFLSTLLPGKFRVSNFGTALALGILVVGLGAVMLGWRRNSAWALWWGHVAQGWLRRNQVSRLLALLG